MLAPLAARDLQSVIAGGARALDAFGARVATSRGGTVLELNQVSDAEAMAAISAAARHGSLELLADARVPEGGYGEQLTRLTDASGGRYVTYGATSEQWQHGKVYHLRSDAGPESWITNLALIPKSRERTELSFVLGGDAAAAARRVAEATMSGDLRATQRAIDEAAEYGVLVNDPQAGRSHLTRGIREVLADGASDPRGLVAVTKGIDDLESSAAIAAAHARGREVDVHVRDVARADAQLLARSGTPTWQVSGLLQPRVNAFFAGGRGVVGTAFLWGNMVGGPASATARDVGLLLDGDRARLVREAALESIAGMQRRSMDDALRAGDLPEHI